MSVAERRAPLEKDNDGIYARVQIAALTNGHLRIPPNFSIAVEIGALRTCLPHAAQRQTRLLAHTGVSDRNTLDVELLGKNENFFLIATEPLIEKYGRGLARNSKGAADHFQALGFHHARGIILPIAIGDGAAGGELKTFHVHANSGCSSLLKVDGHSNRLKWCKWVREKRQVPQATLRQVLTWIGPRPVELVKVDVQGMDLRVIESAGYLLPQVRRFQLEVISDDCHGLYVGQPKCSAVVARAAQLGFEPATPINCKPTFKRNAQITSTAFGCELELMFVARNVSMTPLMWTYHQPGFGGCSASMSSWNDVKDGEVQRTRPSAAATRQFTSPASEPDFARPNP